MRPSINLLFGVHNHQPVGNFANVFERADHDCYHPFIDTLYEYPQIKSTLHFSGSLIDWLLENDASLLQKVKEMVKRQQVEILTGGYYEPVLTIIPEKDRIGQINMLSNFIREYFECEPEGMWIAERVWEPYLVKSLAQAGVKYILLDDFHFLNAGIRQKNLLGYYTTEEEGKSLAIFPISKKLRYSVPFSAPAQVIAYLRSLATEEGKAAIAIVDDGEKFGLWPGTYKWVYQEKWLEQFFRLLIKGKDWIKTETISEYMREHKPLGACRLPGATYEEMMSWSEGNFRNFLSKYPEANSLHKRMLYVSERLNKENEQAQKYLYMGQCNCPYWHGVFGGIYLGHLRHTAYKNLIHAQSLLEKNKESRWIKTELFDKERKSDLIVKNPLMQVFISPELGGSIFELDYIPKYVNLLDTMTRRPEPYHQKIKKRFKKPFQWKKKVISVHDLLRSKEKGLENLLIYDSYRRLSLLDHFFSQNLCLKDFKNSRYKELGDFINGQYEVKEKRQDGKVSVILQRKGRIDYHGREIPLRISKQLSLNDKDAKVSVEYNLENLSANPLDLVFAVEFNISPQSPEHPNNLRCKGDSEDNVYSLKESVETKGITDVRLQDKIGGVETIFNFDKRPNLWSYPLETISASEEGFERNYQQTVILPHWRIRLEKSWQTNMEVTIS